MGRLRIRVTSSPAVAATWLAARLEVQNSGRAMCGPKAAAKLAGVSHRSIQRAYTSGDLVASFPRGRGRGHPVVISMLRLAEWIVAHERDK